MRTIKRLRREIAYIRGRMKVHKTIREYNRLEKMEKKLNEDGDPDGGFVDDWRKLP